MPRGSTPSNRSPSRSRSRTRSPPQPKKTTRVVPARKSRASALSASTLNESLNPRVKVCECGGAVGAFAMIIALPTIVVFLNTICDAKLYSVYECAQEYAEIAKAMIAAFEQSIPQLPIAIGLAVMWLALNGILYLIPIGKRVKGMALRDGTTLSYNINGAYAFLVIHTVIGGLNYAGIIRMADLVDMFTSLMIASIIISISMSLVMYIISFRSGDVLFSRDGNTGNHIYNFWVGRELNPRIGAVDCKLVCELRAGPMGWSLLNWAFVAKAVEMGTCTPSLILIALLESFYVFDALLNEAEKLTMDDTVHDGFGFISCFSDIAWVPFTHTLKAKLLAFHMVQLGNYYVAFCVIIAALGYFIFRRSNTQKSTFLKNPRHPLVSKLKGMRTSKGDSLLISGYWGFCRHPNYLGDWIFTLACSALTGMTSIVPYLQPMYLALLLIRRQYCEEEYMRKNYGEADWNKFTKAVRYRLIPYVY